MKNYCEVHETQVGCMKETLEVYHHWCDNVDIIRIVFEPNFFPGSSNSGQQMDGIIVKLSCSLSTSLLCILNSFVEIFWDASVMIGETCINVPDKKPITQGWSNNGYATRWKEVRKADRKKEHYPPRPSKRPRLRTRGCAFWHSWNQTNVRTVSQRWRLGSRTNSRTQVNDV